MSRKNQAADAMLMDSEEIMQPLQNTAVERPEKLFDVELVVFGTITRAAVKRTIQVLAQTSKGAKRICKSRYRRSEVRSTRETHESPTSGIRDLFIVGEF